MILGPFFQYAMTSTSPFPAGCLPSHPVVLQNIRIVDPVNYYDTIVAANLAASAIAGGFTRVALLPDTTPALAIPGAIARFHQSFKSLTYAP